MKMIPSPSIAVVPLHLVIRNSEFRAVGDNSLAVAVRLEGVGFSAARHPGNFVGLREVLVPLPDFSGLVFPLAVVARERRDTNNARSVERRAATIKPAICSHRMYRCCKMRAARSEYGFGWPVGRNIDIWIVL